MPYGKVTIAIGQKEGDPVKKVMLLGSKDLCDSLRFAMDDNYIVLPCYDPSAGAEILQMHPDILILSLSLPGADGLAFLKGHAELLPPNVLILTPYLDSRILAELARLGVTAVVRMPVALSSLLQKLEAL